MATNLHPDITIACTPFDSLTPQALYQIIQLRNEVFVVEQQCVFQDADGKDPFAHHLTIHSGDVLIAYARLLPPGICPLAALSPLPRAEEQAQENY
jgi:ElaA protein